MNDIYKKVLAQHTAPGQLFETKDVINEKGITYKEYVHFPDSLRGFLDFGLLHGDKDWLVYDDERYSYKDVFEKSAQFGNALIESGIEKGDRVAICMQNNPEYVFAYLGILGIGAVCVPLNSWWVPSEVIYGLEHSDAKVLIADERRLKGLESMTDVKKISTTYSPDKSFISFKDFIQGHDISFPEIDIQRNDNATIYYTSGSTGKPKGVLSSQKAVIATMFSWACYSTVTGEIAKMKDPDADPIVGSDLGILHCVPLFHVTGSHAGLLLSILIGRKIVLMR